MKMFRKNVCVILVIFFIAADFLSCASDRVVNSKKMNRENKPVSNEKDLSAEQLMESERKKINELKESDILKALWKSYLISDKKCIDECLELAAKKWRELYESEDFYEAYKYSSSFLALKELGYEVPVQKIFPQSSDENASFDFLKIYSAELPDFFSHEENALLVPKNIADCIDATVTVWVDKGLKIENGAGYADGVIGSGFFIDKNGYVVTNHHVINDLVDPKYEGYSRLYVKLSGDVDTKIPAKLVGYDPLLDLALLKVEVDAPFVLSLGSSADLSVGDKISAIGTPLGLEGTLTSGIVSSVDRKLNTLGNVFQLDAAVNSGNSGGPLIDVNHKVQAIVFAGMLQYQGLNFAIPVEYLKTELPFLYEGGELLHSWINAYGHTKRNGREKVGLEVQYVLSGGCAQQAFIQEDDVIVELQGESVRSLEDFQNIMMKYQPGTLLSCKYMHDFEEKNTLLYLEKRPKLPGKEIYESDLISTAFIPLFGLKMVPSSTINSKSYRIEKVVKGSVADEYGFSENDQVTVKDIKIQKDYDVVIAQISTKRRKKGFLDVVMILGSSLDSPYYF